MGPGGKGSNQTVAAARLGGEVHFVTKVGADAFGEIARQTHSQAGVNTQFMFETKEYATGAAAIIIDGGTGANAIVVAPGAADALTCEEIERSKAVIAASACFMTQFELKMELVEYGLRLARDLGVPTILDPAPACDCPDSLLELCDYVTPNEVEAEALTGMTVATLEQAERAAGVLLRRGVQNVVLTLGDRGAFVKTETFSQHILPCHAGTVLDTTGAGDAFNGGLAVGLSEGMGLLEAVRFGCVVSGISVTRRGTAPSMPTRAEVDRLYSKVSN